jgi:hypothetical protein
MSICPTARNWFSSNYENAKSKMYSSKYYLPEESWPKKAVWWFEIPIHIIETKEEHFIDLVCQVASNKNDAFHYLKVPVRYLHEHLKNFHVNSDRISLYLSAEPDKLLLKKEALVHWTLNPF